MGLFDFFFKKDTKGGAGSSDPALDSITLEPGLTMARAFAENWEAIAAAAQPSIAVTAKPATTTKLEQSKLAHYPKLPAGFSYPKDKEGQWMFPLAQINFSEVPHLAGYPATGFLQIYISVSDEVYGINFENNQAQENFRVLFFEEAEVENCMTDFSFLQEVMQADYLPVSKPHVLSFAAKADYIGLGDVRYENTTAKIVNDIIGKYPDTLKEDLEESLYENFGGGGHKIGGFAYFTQEDPRLYTKAIEDYVLLLQIDTDDEIMWGDSGVGNFFIAAEDLARKDFSKVVYNWDCC